MADGGPTVVAYDTLSELFPHSDGLTRVCASADGSRTYSGGSDGLIRIYDASPDKRDDDAKIVDMKDLVEGTDTGITSLDCSFDSLAVGTDDGRVTLLDPATGEMQSLLTRADVGHSIRCVRFGLSGKKVAVASDDLVVKVVDVRDPTKIQLLAGHKRAVRALSWSPDGSVLATSGAEGVLRLWDMTSSEAEPPCIKQLEGLIPTGQIGDTADCAAVWHPSGQYFVVANRSHDIVIIARSTWTQTGKYASTGHAHNCAIAALAWSPNGNYLGSAGQDGSVLVWDAPTKTPILRTRPTDASELIDLAWQTGPGANTLLFTDERGALIRWFDLIPSSRPHPTDSAPFAAIREREEERRAATAAAPAGAAPRGRQKSAGTTNAVDDLFGDLPDDDDDDGWIIDDVGDGAFKDAVDELPPPLVFGHQAGKARPGVPSTSYASLGSTQRGQDAIQPGATPFKDKRRYLAFNALGVIHTLERDGYNAVTVDFHDRGAHRASHFEDVNQYEFGALGERGALYATATEGSIIAYRAHDDSWGESSNANGWSATLPKPERATNLAIGDRCALVGTDAGYLRFFSAGGVQTHLVDLGRDVVAVAVGQEWAFVVHRATSAVVNERQDLSYTIYDVDTFEMVQEGAIPLPKRTNLSWIGFTEDGVPALYKSNGVLSLLDRARRPRQGRWMPALDTNTLERREGKQESYWPVAISGSTVQVVILKGEDKHPFFPTPLLQDLELKVPSCELDSAKGQLEEEYLRSSFLLGNQRDGAAADDDEAQQSILTAELELDKLLLRQIQTACKADKLQPALELARLLNRTSSIDAAAKIAGFFHAAGLEERILALKADGPHASEQPAKRAPKWQHLAADEATIPAPLQRRVDPFSRPFSASAAAPPPWSRRSVAPASRPQQQQQRQQQAKRDRADDSGLGSSDALDDEADESSVRRPVVAAPVAVEVEDDDDEPMTFLDDDESALVESPMAAAAPMDEDEDNEPQSMAPAPMTASRPAVSVNPFKKTAASRSAANANAAPSAAHVSARAEHGLKKSNSFFDRVEGVPTAGKKGKGKASASSTESTGGPRQSTLFGLPPPKPVEPAPKKGGKKRKAAAAADDEDESQETQSRPKGHDLKAAFAKAAARPPKPRPTTNDDDDEVEETQVVSQRPEKRARLDAVVEGDDEDFDRAMEAMKANAL